MTDSSDPPPADWEEDTGLRHRRSIDVYHADPARAFAKQEDRLRRMELSMAKAKAAREAKAKATDKAEQSAAEKTARWLKIGTSVAGVAVAGVGTLIVMVITGQSEIAHIQAQHKEHVVLPAHGHVAEDLARTEERIEAIERRANERHTEVMRRFDQSDASLTKLLEERRNGRRR